MIRRFHDKGGGGLAPTSTKIQHHAGTRANQLERFVELILTLVSSLAILVVILASNSEQHNYSDADETSVTSASSDNLVVLYK
jgi:hypothetical protein